MPKTSVFTMKLEEELRAEFIAAAAAAHRPASQVVRELMRDYVRREQDRASHDAFVRAKVEAARTSMRMDPGHDDASVEAEFALRRAEVADRA